jgi:hypothetical protein
VNISHPISARQLLTEIERVCRSLSSMEDIHQREIYETIRINIVPNGNDSKSASIKTSLAVVDSSLKYYKTQTSSLNQMKQQNYHQAAEDATQRVLELKCHKGPKCIEHSTRQQTLCVAASPDTYCRRETSARVPIGIPTGMLVTGILYPWN